MVKTFRLAQKKMDKERLDISNRYLAGEPVSSIAKDKGIAIRNIYYHLGALTPEMQSIHARNKALRKMALPVKKRRLLNKNLKEAYERESNGETLVTIGQNLADFISN